MAVWNFTQLSTVVLTEAAMLVDKCEGFDASQSNESSDTTVKQQSYRSANYRVYSLNKAFYICFSSKQSYVALVINPSK